MIEYLPLVLTGIGVIVSILYYTSVLRNAEKVRQRDQIFQRIQSQDTTWLDAWVETMFHNKADSFEKHEEKYGPETNPEAWVKRNLVSARYESLGVMLKEKMIDPDILYQLYKPRTILTAWSRFENSILILRERFNDPTWGAGFEYLVNETVKRFPNIKREESVF